MRPGSSPGKSKQEPPPSYTTLQRSPCTHRDKGTLNKNMCDAYKQQVSEPIISLTAIYTQPLWREYFFVVNFMKVV